MAYQSRKMGTKNIQELGDQMKPVLVETFWMLFEGSVEHIIHIISSRALSKTPSAHLGILPDRALRAKEVESQPAILQNEHINRISPSLPIMISRDNVWQVYWIWRDFVVSMLGSQTGSHSAKQLLCWCRFLRIRDTVKIGELKTGAFD